MDIALIKSKNPTVVDQMHGQYYSREEFTNINSRYMKFDYLKDSVYINRMIFRFEKNNCFTGYSNSIEITLSDDKLHKGTVELIYKDYGSMKKQYDKLLELIPKEYEYKEPFITTLRKSKEKIGEGIWFYQMPLKEQEKLNEIKIGYEFDFKNFYDREKGEYIHTNEIESYTIHIQLSDLRQSKLTREGF